MARTHFVLALALLLPAVLGGCSRSGQVARMSPDAFLSAYNREYRRLWTDAEGARWNSSTDVSDTNTARRVAAEQAFAAYTGSRETIAALHVQRQRTGLNDLQRRQIEAAWRTAAHNPGTIPEVVDRLIKADATQADRLNGFVFTLRLPGQPPRQVTPNEIDDLLAGSRDLAQRQAVWDCAKSIGPALRDGLADLQGLRNRVAREMGYSSYFGLEVSDYGLTSGEMMALMDTLLAQMKPLYAQLHCWTKHELARRYGVPVPRRIPAHWLDNRWAQEWPGLVTGVDLDALVADRSPEWLVQQAEKFYVSLGMPRLPATFWQRSDLYALPADAPRKKNTHASAWHIDLDQDVRSLMSVKPDFAWFTTAHHELGHIYYYLAYSNPRVPYVLRAGANRGFHEGIGTLIELASNQPPYLREAGLLQPDQRIDQLAWLLNQALLGPVTFIPFSCGTMTHFEHDLYEQDLPPADWNVRWWEYAGRYQGIEPPTPRGAGSCDPATKTHINDDPAQYYDYALSNVILYQLHDHICREILKCDPHEANYFGREDVGRYLWSILSVGATRDWRQLMEQVTGEPLSAKAMLAYFQPLRTWLEEQNRGRDLGFD